MVTKFVSEVLNTNKPIGELNGKWAVMLKLTILIVSILLPFLMTWGIWVTAHVYSSRHHIISTSSFRNRLVETEKIANQMVHEISKLEYEYLQLRKSLKAINESNATDHEIIMVQLSKIQTKLEILYKNK